MEFDENKPVKAEAVIEEVTASAKVKPKSDLENLFEQDEDLGKAVEKIFDETTDLNEIQAKIILLLKAYLKTKKKSGIDVSKISKMEELEKKITEDITNFIGKFTKTIEEDIDPNIGTVSKKDRANLLNIEARKNIKRIMKNFVVYEIYKVMNPKRIAGETKEDNYRKNLIRGGEQLASRYEGGRESDLKEYGAAKVERIKHQALSMSKSGGMGR